MSALAGVEAPAWPLAADHGSQESACSFDGLVSVALRIAGGRMGILPRLKAAYEKGDKRKVFELVGELVGKVKHEKSH